MKPPRSVLNRFGPTLAGLSWRPVPPGFSGAEVWCGVDANQPLFALKAWPAGFSEVRLATIHQWMRQAAHLPYVPSVIAGLDGKTVISEDGRLWDLTRWMTGSPRTTPTPAELETACAAIARLHAVWRIDQPPEPCPGIRNRLRLLREWMSSPTCRGFAGTLTPRLNFLMGHALTLIQRAAPDAIRSLERWEHTPVRLQPCLRDLRGEHVLFDESGVAGVVDYGAMAVDHPAVDLARLLGDFAWSSDHQFAAGLRSYRSADGKFDTPDDLVHQLARSGALGSAIIWLRRLGKEGKWNPISDRVETRFALLVERIERFAPV